MQKNRARCSTTGTVRAEGENFQMILKVDCWQHVVAETKIEAINGLILKPP